MTELKTALGACEDKWYAKGFADAEISVEPVVHKARMHGFREGWLAAFQAMGAPGVSLLWNPKQILYPAPAPPIQSQAGVTDEEDTPSMAELVRAIDTHVESVDLEFTSTFNALEVVLAQPPFINQSSENVPDQQTDDVVLIPSTDRKV